MKYILLNKNTPIMELEYSDEVKGFLALNEIYNIDYAPLSIYNSYYAENQTILKSTNEWFKGRGIPSWRKDLKNLLEKLGVDSTEDLLNKAYGLSLSDQYWLKEKGSNVQWENINFFTNDFEYKAYLDASLDSNSISSKVDRNILHSPNNTTDGMLQKGWIIEDGKRILVKGTFTFNRQEPINEWLASRISERLGFDYCDYKVDWIDNTKLVSKCENFVSCDEEIISAYDVFKFKEKPKNVSDYEFYIKLLEEHHVPNARRNVENMFTVDYLLMNTDRHLKNFGVIRNVNTLEWVRTTPIFDTGQSMQCDKFTNDMNFYKGDGKFFSNSQKDFEAILKTIGTDIIQVKIERLAGICEDYQKILVKYKNDLDMSDVRIEKLVSGLDVRISKLNQRIKIVRDAKERSEVCSFFEDEKETKKKTLKL